MNFITFGFSEKGTPVFLNQEPYPQVGTLYLMKAGKNSIIGITLDDNLLKPAKTPAGSKRGRKPKAVAAEAAPKKRGRKPKAEAVEPALARRGRKPKTEKAETAPKKKARKPGKLKAVKEKSAMREETEKNVATIK